MNSIVAGGKGLKGGSGYAKLGFSTIDEGMLLPSKSGFVQLTNQSGGRRRRGSKRRGSKRRGTKRRGTKRRGSKRRKTHKRKH